MEQQVEHACLRHQNISDTFSGVYYVESVFIKKTSQQKDYTDMALRDKSGSRNVKFWGVVPDTSKGDFVFISAVVESYKGNPSVIAKNVEKADVPEDISNYISHYENIPELVAKFDKVRSQLKEIEAKTGGKTAGMLVDEVYSKAAYDKFLNAPSNAGPYYGCVGGLLANTTRIADGCLRNSEMHKLSDQEMVVMLASALICRIGAIEAFEFKDCLPLITKNGILLGVPNLTMARIMSAKRRLVTTAKANDVELDNEIMLRILHCVAAVEGSGILAQTKEALILNSTYRFDYDMVESMDFIARDENVSGEFTSWDTSKKRRYYVGVRLET